MASLHARSVEVCPELNCFCSDSVRFHNVAISFYLGWTRMEEPGILELLVRLGAQTVGNHRLDDDVSFSFQRVYPEIVS